MGMLLQITEVNILLCNLNSENMQSLNDFLPLLSLPLRCTLILRKLSKHLYYKVRKVNLMKTKKFKICIMTLALVLFTGTVAFAYRNVSRYTVPYLTLEQDVYYPRPKSCRGDKLHFIDERNKSPKYPVVFMIHNGLADKSAWGDYPEEIADAGFFTVNITWQSWDTSQVEKAIDYTLTKYADKIDTSRISFVGGCHGGKDALEIMNKVNDKYNVKTAVLLSVSEIDQAVLDSQKEGHVPMLAYYSLKDELGEYWGDMSKKVAEDTLTQPKKVIALNETAHGNDIVTKASCKGEVRKAIIDWLKEYN